MMAELINVLRSMTLAGTGGDQAERKRMLSLNGTHLEKSRIHLFVPPFQGDMQRASVSSIYGWTRKHTKITTRYSVKEGIYIL